jgi:hypothetical protein
MKTIPCKRGFFGFHLMLLPIVALGIISACGKSESRVLFESAPKLFSPEENLAAASRGARAIAVDSAPSFPIANLNDGTAAPWGAAESRTDAYAAVILPNAQAVREYRISLFSPDQPPRAHLRDIRVVVADSEGNPPNWRVLRSRLGKDQPFSEKVTMPPSADGTVVQIEIDASDPSAGPHKIWGFACFTASRGDERNYLPSGSGNGIYIRELQMK